MRGRIATFPVVVVAALALASAAAFANTIVVDDDGHGSATGCSGTTPIPSTIQAGVNAASPGDTVKVCPGNYPGAVTVNKTLTLDGAKAGVDARNRGTSGESIVSAPGGGPAFTLAANNVTLDGFTIKSSDTGIQTSPNFSGYLIQNNVVTNNSLGIYLNTGAGTQSEVRHNKIASNNASGTAVAGTGIYSDQGANNIVIDQNLFSNQQNEGINFASGTGINVHDNVMKDMPNTAISFFSGVTNSTIDHNTLTNASVNPNGGSAIFIGGNDSTIGVTNNTITRPNFDGIAIRGTATGITVQNNKVIRGGHDGISVTSTTSGATTTTGNTLQRNANDGIFYGTGTAANHITNNTAASNAHFNCEDANGVSTTNVWSANTGGNGSPTGIC